MRSLYTVVRSFSLASLIFIITGLLISCTSKQSTAPVEPPPDQPFKIIGYLPEYRVDSAFDSSGYYATDLIYFSIEPAPSGELLTERVTPSAKTKLNSYKSRFQTRIHIAVGGWGRSDNFAPMSTDSVTRKIFIENLTQFCVANGFSGADYDWEFPQNSAEIRAYSDLIVETAQAFKAHGFRVSAALNISQNLEATAYDAIDRIHVMAYDNNGRHSTYEQAVAAVEGFVNKGVDKSKIALGVPFYGRSITDFSQTFTYAEIVDQYHPAPETDEVAGIYFNGISTIKRKTEYALSQKLAGIMIWEVGQDTNDQTSLLKTIYNTIF